MKNYAHVLTSTRVIITVFISKLPACHCLLECISKVYAISYVLQSNAVSYWLGTNLESALYYDYYHMTHARVV